MSYATQWLDNVVVSTATTGTGTMTLGSVPSQLYKTGAQEIGMSDQVLGELLNVQLSQDNDLSQAIAKMSASLAGLGQPIQPGVTT
jgi:hypothetical protein